MRKFVSTLIHIAQFDIFSFPWSWKCGTRVDLDLFVCVSQKCAYQSYHNTKWSYCFECCGHFLQYYHLLLIITINRNISNSNETVDGLSWMNVMSKTIAFNLWNSIIEHFDRNDVCAGNKVYVLPNTWLFEQYWALRRYIHKFSEYSWCCGLDTVVVL